MRQYNRNGKIFNRYFDHDPRYWDVDEDRLEQASEDLTGCRFCQDIGSRYLYDEDLLLVVHKSKPLAVADLIGLGAFTSDTTAAAVIEACVRHGITAANAMFVYADAALQVTDVHKRYNGLPYIGMFAR